jgi:hypothetical protein
MRCHASWTAILIGALGCGQHSDPPPELGSTPGGYGANVRDAAAPRDAAPGNASDAAITVSTCTAEATRLYVMDTAGVLHSFDPTLLPSADAFKTVGTMNCSLDGGPWAGANSMAIDRNAVAWVTDRDGLLFKVSTLDATCQPTGFRNQQGFTKVGMGFSGDAARGTETLYVVDNSEPLNTGSGKGLASIDLGSLTLHSIANFDGVLTGRGAELTGSGDGRLFGFFPVPSSLAEIDPATAHIVSNTPVALFSPMSGSGEYDFAFSFWGGVFFFYSAWTGNTAGPTTDVTAFDPATGATSLVLPQIGFNVVGAGSSTCVPTHGDDHAFIDGGFTPRDTSDAASADVGDAGADADVDVQVDAGAQADGL